MALFVVATPIGNNADFSTRALETLRTADLVVGEEVKALRQILKAAGVQAPAIDQLNEHSDRKDIEHLLEQCRTRKVALVSDCGTPGFCDPGADLVNACHKAGVPVHAVPGPSSMMTLLSVCGVRVDQFLFYGFLPAKSEERTRAWRELERERHAVIVMETPYRCARLLSDLAQTFKDRYVVLGLNLTQDSERIWRGRARELPAAGLPEEAEPIALILPDGLLI
jgi:16S rRNA (cytidine1402-2'-O)-methyltransferase